MEYGIGSASNLRWLTPEDLEAEFGAKEADRLIDEYDLDAVNNSKKQMASVAASTAVPVGKGGPPPMPSRLNREKSRGVVERPSSPRANSPPKEPVISPRAAATSPRDNVAGSSSQSAESRKAEAKEKLLVLKGLFDDGLITKEEYNQRKGILIDQMLQ